MARSQLLLLLFVGTLFVAISLADANGMHPKPKPHPPVGCGNTCESCPNKYSCSNKWNCCYTGNGCKTVDKWSDPKNCGYCGKCCNAGEKCCHGQCKKVCGGDCQKVCYGNKTCCNNKYCVDLFSDDKNCGWCGKCCKPDEYCKQKQCVKKYHHGH